MNAHVSKLFFNQTCLVLAAERLRENGERHREIGSEKMPNAGREGGGERGGSGKTYVRLGEVNGMKRPVALQVRPSTCVAVVSQRRPECVTDREDQPSTNSNSYSGSNKLRIPAVCIRKICTCKIRIESSKIMLQGHVRYPPQYWTPSRVDKGLG